MLPNVSSMLDAIRGVLEGAMTSHWLLLVIVGMAVLDALVPAVPSEALIITAGVAAAAGTQNIVFVIAAAAFGSLIGESIAYAVGRWFGPLVRRRLTPGTAKANGFAKVERLLLTKGGPILLTARFLPGGRTVAALAAGAARFPTPRFLAFSAPGTVLSAAWVAGLGFVGGAAFANDPLVALLFSLALGSTVTFVMSMVQRRRRQVTVDAGSHERIERPQLVTAGR